MLNVKHLQAEPSEGGHDVYWKTVASLVLILVTMATAIGMYGIIFQE